MVKQTIKYEQIYLLQLVFLHVFLNISRIRNHFLLRHKRISDKPGATSYHCVEEGGDFPQNHVIVEYRIDDRVDR